VPFSLSFPSWCAYGFLYSFAHLDTT
jgi:hypothetical protein